MGNKAYKVKRSHKKGGLAAALILIFTALVISLLIAAVWQISGAEEPKLSSMRSVGSGSPESSQSRSSSEDEESMSQVQPPQEPVRPVFDGAVPESAEVAQSYFDDAVFVGDSVTEGMLIYDGMKNAKIFAGRGINLDTVYTAEVVKKADGGFATIMDSLENATCKKVYVMLGGNEVRDIAVSESMRRYGKVIDDAKRMQPDAIVYVQSVTPVTLGNHYNVTNESIDAFNEALMALCKEKDVYYLNVAEALKDENGNLPEEASPNDGMHFGQEYFNKWFAYLRTHTVDGEPAEEQLANKAQAALGELESSGDTESSAD